VIRALKANGFFACACQIDDSMVSIGMLVVTDERLLGQQVEVRDVDTNELHLLILPDQENMDIVSYRRRLSVVAL